MRVLPFVIATGIVLASFGCDVSEDDSENKDDDETESDVDSGATDAPATDADGDDQDPTDDTDGGTDADGTTPATRGRLKVTVVYVDDNATMDVTYKDIEGQAVTKTITILDSAVVGDEIVVDDVCTIGAETLLTITADGSIGPPQSPIAITGGTNPGVEVELAIDANGCGVGGQCAVRLEDTTFTVACEGGTVSVQ